MLQIGSRADLRRLSSWVYGCDGLGGLLAVVELE